MATAIKLKDISLVVNMAYEFVGEADLKQDVHALVSAWNKKSGADIKRTLLALEATLIRREKWEKSTECNFKKSSELLTATIELTKRF